MDKFRHAHSCKCSLTHTIRTETYKFYLCCETVNLEFLIQSFPVIASSLGVFFLGFSASSWFYLILFYFQLGTADVWLGYPAAAPAAVNMLYRLTQSLRGDKIKI